MGWIRNVSDWLSGKKTYILAGLYALVATVEFIAKGDFSFSAIGAFAQSSAIAGVIASIRAAITKHGTN